MATVTFTAGVYSPSQQKTINSSLSLSGADNEVVLDTSGNVTSLLTFGVLYDYNADGEGHHTALSAITLEKDGVDTTIKSTLTGSDIFYAIKDIHGTTVTFKQTAWGDETLFPDLTGSAGKAVGPEHRRKRHLGY